VIAIKNLFVLTVIAILFSFNNKLHASHMAGAELTYKWLADSTYQINYVFYRDCDGINEPFSVPLCITNTCTGSVTSLTLPKLTVLPNGQANGTSVSTGCAGNPTSCDGGNIIGYKEWHYSANYTLPSRCANWVFSTTYCCRNAAITNLQNADSYELYTEATLNNVIAQNNSSPVFTTKPVPYVCVNQPYSYNNGTVEANGDSLTFTSIQPRYKFTGACANTPGVVPYSSFLYSPLNPLDCANTFNCNPVTGEITFTASSSQVAVVAVVCKEYKNGVLAGSVMRDIQMVIAPCTAPVPTQNLIQNSIIGGVFDTNINYVLQPCADSLALSFCFLVKSNNPTAVLIPTANNALSLPGSTITYTGIGTDSVVGCVSWQPTLADSGLNVLVLTVKDSACSVGSPFIVTNSITIPVFIGQYISLTNLNVTNITNCAVPFSGTATVTANSSASPLSYSINPINDTNSTGIFTNLPTGAYTVTVTDQNTCTKTETFLISSLNSPTIDSVAAIPSLSCTNNLGNILVQSIGGAQPITYALNTGQTNNNGNFTNLIPGTYTLTITNALGCTNSTIITLGYFPPPNPNVSIAANPSNGILCAGGTITLTASGANTYNWLNGITNGIAFTPTSSGIYTVIGTDTSTGCVDSTIFAITIIPIVTPSFTAIAPICSAGFLSTLPLISQNGITGTWNPTLNNLASTTYTFTPSSGQCAVTTTLEILVDPNVLPTFLTINPICAGAFLAPLDNISDNGIAGTWSPALNNLVTTTYTFTPTSGQCAVTATLIIVVNPIITPTFTAIVPICAGATLNALPTTSLNNISGVWAPALNNLTTTTYTFTPSSGQCAVSTTLTIIVNPILTPTFAAIGPICAGTVIAPLPTTSLNGITGTWSPALNNLTTGNYVITPDFGQCAVSTTLTIIVNPNVTPTFAPIAPKCAGTAIAPLPLTSLNGVTGTWAPAINNTTTTTYTFTPSSGQCAFTTIITIVINPIITPTFNSLTAICANGALASLPTTSNNFITGSWAPAPNNITTTTYTFTPTIGQCAINTTLTGVVNPNIIPTFASLPVQCVGATLSPLPTISINGITGTWSPAPNNQVTTTYTFTPTSGLCALTKTLTQTIKSPIGVAISSVNAVCGNANGSLNIGTVNNGTAPYLFSVNNAAFTTNLNYNNLNPGTFSITVQDANGCEYDTILNITNIAGPSVVNTTSNNTTCGNQNGSINVSSVVGGTVPYTYSINGGIFSSTNNFSNLPIGSYTIVAKDSNGCLQSAIDTLINIAGPTTFNFDTSNTFCGYNNGSISFYNTIGGTAPYTYSLNNGAFANTTFYNNLAIGSYTLTVADANLCKTTINANINGQPGPTLLVLNASATTCAKDNGIITIGQIIGGTPFFEFSLNNQAFSINTVYNNMPSGSYTVVAQDINGCTISATATITPSAGITGFSLKTKNAKCGVNNGVLEIENILGGTGPYNISINGGAATNALVYNNLDAGTYEVVITDAFGCTLNRTAVITKSEAITNFKLNGTEASCYLNDATINISELLGGTAPFIYNLEPGNYSNGSGTFMNLKGNITYTATVTDVENCSFIGTVYIPKVECCKEVFVPTAFTPNEDNINDVLIPAYADNLVLKEFIIVNRYGEIVFSSTDKSVGWKGTYKGKDCDMNVYFYYLKYFCPVGDKEFVKKGDFTLIR
jgi:gliding motility-associated-like protein